MTVPQILQLLICHDHSVMPEKNPALDMFQTILLMDREFRYACKSIQLESTRTAVWQKVKWQWPLHAASVRLKTQLPASSYTTLLLLKVQCVKIGGLCCIMWNYAFMDNNFAAVSSPSLTNKLTTWCVLAKTIKQQIYMSGITSALHWKTLSTWERQRRCWPLSFEYICIWVILWNRFLLHPQKVISHKIMITNYYYV